MQLIDYLTRAKAAINTTVDAELARRLHISTAALCDMKKTGSMSENTAAYLGEILGMEPALILLDVRAAKSKNRAMIASVRRLLQQAGIVGTVAALAVDHAARCILCKMPRLMKYAQTR